MCSARTVVRWVLVACTLHGTTARGQDIRAYRARVDSLQRVFLAADARLAAFNDSVRQFTLHDTARAGPLTVLADERMAAMTRGATDIAARRLAAIYGDAADSLRSAAFAVRQSVDTNEHLPHAIVGRVQNRGIVLEHETDADSAAIGATLFELATGTLADRMDLRLRQWLGGIELDSVRDLEWTLQRLELISSDSRVARQCYDGVLASCRLALELTPPADPMMSWYDAAGRRRIVEKSGAAADRVNAGATRRCLAGADTACIAVLRLLPQNVIPKPLSRAAHVDLERLALQLGGPGAARRMIVTPGGPIERVSATAGIPIDSLIVVWRHRVRDARTPSDDMSPTIAATSLAWLLLLGGLSLRSSRWR